MRRLLTHSLVEINSGLRTPSLSNTLVNRSNITRLTISKTQGLILNRKYSVPSRDLVDLEESEQHSYDYDLVVIGGGSGGLACSQEAAKLGKKVAVIDYVNPSPQGTKWGLGGTCVNVGCIPKKLMHQAALLGEAIEDAKKYGWEIDETTPTLKWEKMIQEIGNYIKSLNWGYRVKLRESKVDYVNAFAAFKNAHTIETTDIKARKRDITARRFVLAVGGRPRYLDIPGAKEYAITSDDIFWMSKPPGKTLVIGASYVALECAGFLTSFGYPTTVMARSTFLRHFDQQMSEQIVDYMSGRGTQFMRACTPIKIDKIDGRLRVDWFNHHTNKEEFETFDTVMLAVGREPQTSLLEVSKAGVLIESNGKIITSHERTNVPHIYAVGDVLAGKPELTPVAILAGKLLARRLYANSKEVMDYNMIPTAVFTPIEYGTCGLSEEVAKVEYGDENIEVYHAYYQPLEWTVSHREENACYGKIICNKKDNERVIGVHVLGPHSGDIVQGIAIAMRCGATKHTLDNTVGIHPTVAEEFTKMDITKRSGADPKKTGC